MKSLSPVLEFIFVMISNYLAKTFFWGGGLEWETFLQFLEVHMQKGNISNSYYTEYNIYCGFINIVGSYIRLSYIHPFQ